MRTKAFVCVFNVHCPVDLTYLLCDSMQQSVVDNLKSATSVCWWWWYRRIKNRNQLSGYDGNSDNNVCLDVYECKQTSFLFQYIEVNGICIIDTCMCENHLPNRTDGLCVRISDCERKESSTILVHAIEMFVRKWQLAARALFKQSNVVSTKSVNNELSNGTVYFNVFVVAIKVWIFRFCEWFETVGFSFSFNLYVNEKELQ